MSQWTHVNASIRYDGILGMGIPTKKELGKICKWEDGDNVNWDDSFVPCGSEGSIDYEMVKTGGENSLACLVVVFTGDLRDYGSDGDVEDIVNYFERITMGKMIRSGILEIDVEYGDTFVFAYYDKAKQWMNIKTIAYEKATE